GGGGGGGIGEGGFDRRSGRQLVAVDRRYFRPTEVDLLQGDAGKAREKLGWQPMIGLEQLVAEMVEQDLKEAGRTGK
ncbi:MAG: GDP-mannose 4,6-dehydratase, partial [Negativicutes bacterium]|nr:GDP-mannose 4,6-dehydratase [Negativicutes bacterium]